MKIALRADADECQGAGHVMRCLALAEAAIARGHRVTLLGSIGNVPWLWETLSTTGVSYLECEADTINIDLILRAGFDGIVVDSYRIPSRVISHLETHLPSLAIVDGDSRGIRASLYLDQNLGASRKGVPSGYESRWLGGSDYALVRDAVLAQRQNPSDTVGNERPRIVAFMGGTDPGGAIVRVSESLLAQEIDVDLTLVCPQQWFSSLEALVSADPRASVIRTTFDLPRILGQSDIVVSAAGTSAWDICTMARPAVLVAVVNNQRESLSSIEREGLALCVDATRGGSGTLSDVGAAVSSLVHSRVLQTQLAQRSFDLFDGQGKVRVVQAIERVWATGNNP